MILNRLCGKVSVLKNVYKSYCDKVILKGFDYTFKKGERIGVVGKNGAGKSTFLEILQERVQPDSGKINIGDTVVFGNFSQQGLEIKEDVRVIEYVKNIAESFPLAGGGSLSAAQFLQLFLFPPDQQYTYLSKLSGGEKKRLQLLSILFKNPNFLILDEPTNDLDLPTLSVLENFLSEYQGCLLIVSHDRYFMDRLVDHLFVFEGDGEVRDFPGNYTQYRLEQKTESRGQKAEGSGQRAEGREQRAEGRVEEEQSAENKKSDVRNPKPKKLSYKEQREFEQLEKDLPLLEKEKAEIAEKMSAADLPFEDLQKLSERITIIAQQLEEKELRWLELSELM
jgi:ATP-binding cassette subfamily F protein uup